jgi:hypothetical protein
MCSFSTFHVSTGSTVDTWLSQTAVAQEDAQEIVGYGPSQTAADY